MEGMIFGTIGNEKVMLPARKFITIKGEKTPILTFKMFEQNGSGQSVQVNMRDTDFSRKIFNHLSAGRRVLVKGTVSANPNVPTNENGQIKLDDNGNKIIWINQTIWATQINLVDTKLETTFSNCLKMLNSDTQVINQLMDKVIGEEITSVDDFTSFLIGCFKEYAESRFHAGRDEESFVDEDSSTQNPMTDGALKE